MHDDKDRSAKQLQFAPLDWERAGGAASADLDQLHELAIEDRHGDGSELFVHERNGAGQVICTVNGIMSLGDRAVGTISTESMTVRSSLARGHQRCLTCSFGVGVLAGSGRLNGAIAYSANPAVYAALELERIHNHRRDTLHERSMIKHHLQAIDAAEAYFGGGLTADLRAQLTELARELKVMVNGPTGRALTGMLSKLEAVVPAPTDGGREVPFFDGPDAIDEYQEWVRTVLLSYGLAEHVEQVLAPTPVQPLRWLISDDVIYQGGAHHSYLVLELLLGSDGGILAVSEDQLPLAVRDRAFIELDGPIFGCDDNGDVDMDHGDHVGELTDDDTADPVRLGEILETVRVLVKDGAGITDALEMARGLC